MHRHRDLIDRLNFGSLTHKGASELNLEAAQALADDNSIISDLTEQLECAVLWLDNCPGQSFATGPMSAALRRVKCGQ